MTAGRQPFLHDQVVLVSAPTMAICPPSGQLDGAGAGGLYTADRRVLSVLRVQVGGAEPSDPRRARRRERRPLRRRSPRRRGADAGCRPAARTATCHRRHGCRAGAHRDPDVRERRCRARRGQGDHPPRVRLRPRRLRQGRGFRPVPVTTTTTADGFEVISAEVPGWSAAVHATPAPSDTVYGGDGSVDLGFPLQIPGGGAASIVLTVVPVAPVDARVVAPPGRRDVVGRDEPADPRRP